MSYVIQNADGEYLIRPWGYTAKLDHAMVYATREEAEEDRCGNERVLTIEQAMRESL